MAEKPDDKELVHPHEFMRANAIQLDVMARLSIEKGNHHGGGVFHKAEADSG